jgi:hypothetical protein
MCWWWSASGDASRRYSDGFGYDESLQTKHKDVPPIHLPIERNNKNFMEVDGASIPVDMDGVRATSGWSPGLQVTRMLMLAVGRWGSLDGDIHVGNDQRVRIHADVDDSTLVASADAHARTFHTRLFLIYSTEIAAPIARISGASQYFSKWWVHSPWPLMYTNFFVAYIHDS